MNDELQYKKEAEENEVKKSFNNYDQKKEGTKYCSHCEQEIPPGKEIIVVEHLVYPND
jgi:hypothetical protein